MIPGWVWSIFGLCVVLGLLDGFNAKEKGMVLKISIIVIAVTVRIKDMYASTKIYKFSEYATQLTPRIWEEWETWPFLLIFPKRKIFRKYSRWAFWAKVMRAIIKLFSTYFKSNKYNRSISW